MAFLFACGFSQSLASSWGVYLPLPLRRPPPTPLRLAPATNGNPLSTAGNAWFTTATTEQITETAVIPIVYMTKLSAAETAIPRGALDPLRTPRDSTRTPRIGRGAPRDAHCPCKAPKDLPKSPQGRSGHQKESPSTPRRRQNTHARHIQSNFLFSHRSFHPAKKHWMRRSHVASPICSSCWACAWSFSLC